MKKSQLLGAVCAVLLTSITVSANATLVPKLGGQVVYDTDLYITWMADANYSAEELTVERVSEIVANNSLVFSDSHILTTSDFNTDGSGLMTWWGAMAWADQLVFGGVSDWRLPSTLPLGASCSGQSTSTGTGCTGSEMGHLANVDGVSTSSPSPFLEVQSGLRWSGTELGPSYPNDVWSLEFLTGGQNSGHKAFSKLAWAVHDGDITAVPIPPALWLFGSALLGLIGMAKKKAA
jgi:hypothetical protein